MLKSRKYFALLTPVRFKGGVDEMPQSVSGVRSSVWEVGCHNTDRGKTEWLAAGITSDGRKKSCNNNAE